MQLVNGLLHVCCGKCGMNATHTTKTHNSWASNPTTFKLPSTYFYVKELPNWPLHTAPPPARAGPGSAADSATGSASGMISINRASLESKLASFE
jgi:hypothetical protein